MMGGDKFKDEYSLAFDGSNDYVATSFVPDYISTNATTAFWIKMANFSGTQQMGIHNSKRWYHGFSGSNINIGVANTHNGSSLITPSPALVVGQWIHYCITAIDGTATVYINGLAQGTMSYTQSSGTDPNTGYMIGARDNSSTAGNYIECNISEVVHYNVGLTASQVKTIYNGREPYNHKEGVASGNLQAWYRMGDGTGDAFEYINNEATGYSLGTNLVQGNDANFEGSGNWVGAGGASVTPDYDSGDAGHSSTLRIEAGSVSYDTAQLPQSDLSSTLTAGKIYLVTFDFKNINTTDRTTDNYLTIGNTLKQNISRTASGWTYYKSYFVATDNSTNLRIYCNSDDGHADNEILIDSFSVQEVGTNAGYMTNMSADDIEGDTP